MEALKDGVEKFPDGYLWECEKHLKVRQATVHYALKRLKTSI
jgi:hypothetical protein